jgi:DNA polymerase-1
MKRLVVIDGKSVFYRGYYAMGNLSLSDGTPTGGVYGFAAISLEIVKKLNPDYVAVAWDKSKTNIDKRREIYAEYKANRQAAPEDFYAQIPLLHGLIDVLGWKLFECDGYEADDIIGTLALQADEAGDFETIIISSDLDMLQIVDENTRLYRLKTGFTEIEEIDVAGVEEKYGIKKDQLLDFKALKGDASDNIPGVPGIGEKGAVKLLSEYGTLDGIYERIDEVKGSVHDKLVAGKESAYMSRKLSEIFTDAPVLLGDIPRLVMDKERVVGELERLEFRSLVRRFSTWLSEEQSSGRSEVNFSEHPSARQNQNNINSSSEDSGAPNYVTTQNRSLGADVILTGGTKSSEKLTSEGVFVSWDVKGEWHREGMEELPEKVWDLGQGAFLLNPLARKDEEARGEINSEYWRQQEEFSKYPKLKQVAEELDMPLIQVLYRMEKEGIGIDIEKFTALDKELNERLKKIEQNIYTEAGEEFNINSPMQLSEVLFGKLGLPTTGVKKKQRFYSTGQKELDKLRPLAQIIPMIEEYRELAKLKSTYVGALPKLADENGRIHTIFTQNVTATGRLSSVSPNLQNIPVRTEEGKRIRECFVAKPGCVFVSADYSQFELRLAAVMAGDEALIEDFNAGLDIHTKTAADVFNVSMDVVTKDQRRAAKVINFGVLYGMSAKGLSDATDMSIWEAKEFIARYFEVRKPIRRYLDEVLAQAKTQGYVETFYGRRRPTPDVKSSNFLIRAAAERAAMNMPIQGTEADLMKRAMVRVSYALSSTFGARSRALAQVKTPKVLDNTPCLILQIHDSLMVECREGDAKNVMGTLKEVMEGVAPELAIKLAMDVSAGKNWGEI